MSKTMTTIKHHLNDQMLMGYSAGTLPEAFSLVIATHVSMCDDCRARLESFDAVGGAVMEDCGTAQMSDDALAATLALIAKADAETGSLPAPTHPAASDVFPAPLQEYTGGDLDKVKWRNVGGGVQQSILKTSKDATVRLLRIPAGAAMPDHGHNGTEMTLVLKGAFRDEHDRFARGDIEIADEHVHHTPIAEEGEDCICLAVTDARLRFNAFIPRIAQHFLRI